MLVHQAHKVKYQDTLTSQSIHTIGLYSFESIPYLVSSLSLKDGASEVPNDELLTWDIIEKDRIDFGDFNVDETGILIKFIAPTDLFKHKDLNINGIQNKI